MTQVTKRFALAWCFLLALTLLACGESSAIARVLLQGFAK
jgi:hypothetical protein